MSNALHPFNAPPKTSLLKNADSIGSAGASSGDTETVVSFCTSEQMDLLRQVFEEFDRSSRRSHLITITHERHR